MYSSNCFYSLLRTKMDTMMNDMQSVPYRTVVKYAMSIGLPGNLKKLDYIELLSLYHMDVDIKCIESALDHIMKTKRQTMKKSTSKKLLKNHSVGRPQRRLSMKTMKFMPISDSSDSSESIPMHTSVARVMPLEKIRVHRITKTLKPKSLTPEVQMYPSSSMENMVYQPPIAKTTSKLLRNMLLSPDRIKFNSSATTNSSFTTTNNNPYSNYCQFNNSKSRNLEVPSKSSRTIETTCKIKWKNNKKSNISTKEIKPIVSGNKYLSSLQAFPDIPQLADVDINASFELDNSNYSIIDQTDTDTGLCIDDSDTLSNQSAEIMEQEQQDFDQRWAMSIRMENGETTTPINYETSTQLNDGSLLELQDTALVQNDVIQDYIETNNVQFMQLPDSSCEVIRTLQYYESRILTNSRTFPDCNSNGSIITEQTNTTTNHTLAEFANMLPCPISGCLWYSHSATLYVHLFTYHQQMIYYGNSIRHVFRCEDIKNFCFFTHLQYVQNTIYIVTVAFDCYNHTYISTIQHVSSYGDNTSASPTTAVLTTDSQDNNIDHHSWSGQVQPYSVPLDILHADGRCLFIDPINSENVIINVNLTMPLIYSNNSMFACL